MRANVREERLKVVTNAGQVRFNGFGVNMCTLEGHIVTQGLGGGVNGQGVKFAEREVGVCGGGIGVGGGGVDSHSEEDGALVDETLRSPGEPLGLPGCWGDGGHFLAAPIAS